MSDFRNIIGTVKTEQEEKEKFTHYELFRYFIDNANNESTENNEIMNLNINVKKETKKHKLEDSDVNVSKKNAPKKQKIYQNSSELQELELLETKLVILDKQLQIEQHQQQINENKEIAQNDMLTKKLNTTKNVINNAENECYNYERKYRNKFEYYSFFTYIDIYFKDKTPINKHEIIYIYDKIYLNLRSWSEKLNIKLEINQEIIVLLYIMLYENTKLFLCEQKTSQLKILETECQTHYSITGEEASDKFDSIINNYLKVFYDAISDYSNNKTSNKELIQYSNQSKHFDMITSNKESLLLFYKLDKQYCHYYKKDIYVNTKNMNKLHCALTGKEIKNHSSYYIYSYSLSIKDKQGKEYIKCLRFAIAESSTKNNPLEYIHSLFALANFFNFKTSLIYYINHWTENAKFATEESIKNKLEHFRLNRDVKEQIIFKFVKYFIYYKKLLAFILEQKNILLKK